MSALWCVALALSACQAAPKAQPEPLADDRQLAEDQWVKQLCVDAVGSNPAMGDEPKQQQVALMLPEWLTNTLREPLEATYHYIGEDSMRYRHCFYGASGLLFAGSSKQMLLEYEPIQVLDGAAWVFDDKDKPARKIKIKEGELVSP